MSFKAISFQWINRKVLPLYVRAGHDGVGRVPLVARLVSDRPPLLLTSLPDRVLRHHASRPEPTTIIIIIMIVIFWGEN